MDAVLDGELAVLCNLQSATAGFKSQRAAGICEVWLRDRSVDRRVLCNVHL